MKQKSKKWTPFAQATSAHNAATKKEVVIPADEKIYLNSRYQVSAREHPKPFEDLPRMVMLSIRNLDRSAKHDWRDFQRIKNEILGPEWEGIEIYPAESRLVDTSNQYWMWCFEPPFRLPFGFNERVVSEAGVEIGAVQRPWGTDNKPLDLTYISKEMLAEALKTNPEFGNINDLIDDEE